MKSRSGRWLFLASGIISALLLLAAVAAAWFYAEMRKSLPQLDGSAPLAALSAPVKVERDALGVPTIGGRSRDDVARALGYLHAQDRFFQMDLLRRRSAGELSALFGPAALPLDRASRMHGFRALARQVAGRLSTPQRALLESYTAGVNAGLAALRQRPFEYLALRATPTPWQVEDSILVIYTMTLDLQDGTGAYELSLATLRDHLGFVGVAFFAPLLLPDDGALDGSTGKLPPVPGPEVLDLRKPVAATASARAPAADLARAVPEPDFAPGSNNFALAGAHTATGSALVANDPHLDLGVPNIWYRASLVWETPTPQRITGVTLPGLPVVVLGSNGHIAWGMTDAYADTGDLVSVEVNPIDHRLYKLPGQPELIQIEERPETIEVKGGKTETITVPWTHWGPVITTGKDGRPLVYHWVAHDPAATDLAFMELVEAQTVAEAVAIAHRVGMPAQNLVVGDTAGQIAWTIIGRLPQRVGFDGRLPTSWSYGDRRWAGLLPPERYPTVMAPASGRIWTANNRVLGGKELAAIGDGDFAAPTRAIQIRDALAPLERATPADLRAIQLDDRALLMNSWQKRLLAVLTPEAVAAKKSRAEFRRLVEHWEGRASVDSVSYRLVRSFRIRTADLVFTPIFADCVEAMPEFNWGKFHYEAPLQALLDEKPLHFLNPKYGSWEELQLAAVDRVIDDLDRLNVPLDRATWGRYNTARIYHPLGRILPRWLGGWLNLPADQLPGDSEVPRVQKPTFGASMRMVISPGREAEGLLHMVGGQSGHPLSPYYHAGHEAWVKGEPTPFLPGATVHTLTLFP